MPRRLAVVLVISATMMTLSACGDARPGVPSPAPRSEAFTPPPPPPPSAAALAIEDPFVIVWPAGPGYTGYGYETRFLLHETAGTSGATLREVRVYSPNGDSEPLTEGCLGTTWRIPPGSTDDSFYTDANWKGLSYCAPSAGGTTTDPAVLIVVTFTDDDGRSGRSQAVARVR